ncbi:phosphorylase, glycogen/starch/alpha-glucan family [Shuttleworthella satelles DSM 14600]|uniref:Alpha-1,4 glucan phosphorylase n=2 Tax=Shuttleworthella TaxID=177971 RepID=C4G929_9FIRM|nr:glycogen/starch/alpha-glucan phosphorylase [Shuttleworthia satelles]EEP29126.1 phosphorylase, glycogen/starch/alpha-glucan family [Shuttleworthia satelles DSM 14600]
MDQQMMRENLETSLRKLHGVGFQEANPSQLADAAMTLVQEELQSRPLIQGKKKLYYISAEFLIGKLLSNNLINLGWYQPMNELLAERGLAVADLEDLEEEPSLGNGGLGRLAACFLDSIASLGLPGDGVGLNYHLGLFRQEFRQNKQCEMPNPWLSKDHWEKRSKISFTVPFAKFHLQSTLYDIFVPGYGNEAVNRLRLFDVDSVDENLPHADGIQFDKWDVAKSLTLFLYPDDSDRDGQLLRIYQQYFMVSNAAQLILMEAEERGVDLHHLDEAVVIQINDTHPSMVIPELIRLLIERGIDFDQAAEIVSRTCAYTNHTILAEALEKWPIDYLEEVVPHLMPIIRRLDEKVREKITDASTYLIDDQNRVHMAHMDIHYGFSVNGVAALHTEILKESELKNFYQIYPEKFNNKTNGITFRRWLMACNPALSSYIQTLIGNGFKTDATELEKLMAYVDDAEVHERLDAIRRENKQKLSDFLKETQGVVVDPVSVFDVQIKRLHEYKRQQMNALFAIHQYLEIKKGNLPHRPITMIFGAKAAPAYIIAKDIIHLLLCLQELTCNDPEVAPYLKVIMVENYNVTKAEKIIPAADISEQISLASKEASGTSNMKFMLNGALTLGTEDGANVEIGELVGPDNIYIFGKKKDYVIDAYAQGSYHVADYYADPQIRQLVDFIIGDQMRAIGDAESLERLHREISGKDYFMALLDLRDYIETKNRLLTDFEDRENWLKKEVVNIAHAGFFSSDRTIAQYNQDIWHLV